MIFVTAATEVAPLAAEPLVKIGSFEFTNAMLYGLIAAIGIVVTLGLAAAWTQLHPRSKLAFAVETVVDLLTGMIEESFGDRQKARKHIPFLLTLFFFILTCNLSGLLPGVGSITAEVNGENVPLLRAFTTDLNATLAMAILTIGSVQFFALKELGFRQHARHYFNSWNPMNIFIGFTEVFSELLRIVTLSMRLFGVIYAGEVLLHAIAILAGNFAWAATLPIVLLEIFFSIIQAYLFMMLATVYLAMATTHKEEHDDKHEVESPKLQAKTV